MSESLLERELRVRVRGNFVQLDIFILGTEFDFDNCIAPF